MSHFRNFKFYSASDISPISLQFKFSFFRVQIPAWACEKVANDLGLGGGFRRVLRFPPLLTTG